MYRLVDDRVAEGPAPVWQVPQVRSLSYILVHLILFLVCVTLHPIYINVYICNLMLIIVLIFFCIVSGRIFRCNFACCSYQTVISTLSNYW